MQALRVLLSNPPYYLDINNSGWTSAVLRQRLENNGAIFGGGAIAVALTAASVSNAEVLTVSYAPSTGSATNIFQRSIPTGTLTAYKNAIDLPASTNSDTGTSAYADILFSMDGTSHFQLTNIQITGQSENLSTGFDNPTDAPEFQELSYEQVENGEFNVYKEGLIFKPIPSYLVGWDFPLNPAQFFGDGVIAQSVGVNKSYYAWDQTIIFQSANSGITVTRDVNDFAILLTPAVDGQAAIIQYLQYPYTYEILSKQISVNVRALCSSAHTLKCTLSLWYTKDGSLPNIASGTNNSLVATLDVNGKPATFNGNWTEVTKTQSQDAVFTLTEDITDFGFNIWDMSLETANIKDATFFAIVIGTAAMSSITLQNPGFVSVGLSSGSIPTIPAPQTLDQVLRECQYYYEKSYSFGVAPGTVTAVGQVMVSAKVLPNQGTADEFLYAQSFSQQWKQTKRTIPVHNLYSPATGTINKVSMGIYHNGANPTPSSGANPRDVVSSVWTLTGQSVDGAFSLCGSTDTQVLEVPVANATVADEGITLFHYTLDSRLGIV